MMYATFATTIETVNEVQLQIGLAIETRAFTPKIIVATGDAHQIMQLIGRFADNGDDCLIKAEVM